MIIKLTDNIQDDRAGRFYPVRSGPNIYIHVDRYRYREVTKRIESEVQYRITKNKKTKKNNIVNVTISFAQNFWLVNENMGYVLSKRDHIKLNLRD